MEGKIDWKKRRKELGLNVEPAQVREKLAKEALLSNIVHRGGKRLVLELRKAFNEGVTVREIAGNYFLCYNWYTRKYMPKFNAVMKNNCEIWTQEKEDTLEIISLLAMTVPDGDKIKGVDAGLFITAREKYRRKLLTPEIQNAIYDNSHDFEDADLSAKELPEDNVVWIKLFRAVAQNEDLLEILQYVRASKATLKPHSKYGYYIDRSLFSEKAKETYDKRVKPYLEEHSAELLTALEKIAK